MPNKHRLNLKSMKMFRPLFGILIPLLFLGVIAPDGILIWLQRSIFITLVLIFALLGKNLPEERGRIRVRWFNLLLLALAAFTWIFSWILEGTLLAWSGLVFWFAGLLALSPTQPSKEKLMGKLLDNLFLGALAGIVPVLLNQIMVRFSEEEFFTLLSMILLCGLWWIIALVFIYSFPTHVERRSKILRDGISLTKTWIKVGALVILAVVIGWAGRSYQRSFYPQTAPSYSGIDSDTPFLCGELPETSADPNEQDVQTRMAEIVASRAKKTAKELAFLAIVNEDESTALAFKDILLEHAQAGYYTGPAHSIKYGQYEAAQELYFYHEIQRIFPNLFTEQETAQIETWFHQVNQRAQTIEWVDFLYAFAFTKAPDGAYENQEIGAGLFSLLETFNLADPKLSSANQAYLSNFSGGWENSFRVTDDAVAYQPVWLTNAYFQSLYQPPTRSLNQELSFDWFLHQALPDGAPLGYNFPSNVSLAAASLLGAIQVEDGQFLWLADRALDFPDMVSPLPGTEQPLPADLNPQTPTKGSCLLYGNSGLPGQTSTLAPDKIVLRQGWDEEDLYILLNLRFTGWHRYKATNTITLVYAGEALIKDQTTEDLISWLPAGRAKVRDKRIPRENLSGLLVPRKGLDAVLQTLLGIGGLWAQDPPFYAEVETFETSPTVDLSRTAVNAWHGWDHTRSIYLYRNGPAFVLDEASGPLNQPASLRWQIASDLVQTEANRFSLGLENNLEMVLLGEPAVELQLEIDSTGTTLSYEPPAGGDWALLTILLPREWQDAQVLSFEYEDGIAQVSLNFEGKTVTYQLHGRIE